MELYMSGWKEICETDIPPVKKKGFAQDVIIREKVSPKRSEPARVGEEDFQIYEDDDQTVLLQEEDNYGDLEATVILNAPKRLVMSIVRNRTGEIREVNKTPFVMGKSSGCDYIIDANPTISRRHAQIIKENGEYYLEDLGSSNYTYVNEEEIKKPVRVTHNMEFRMSDEDFRITVELR